MKIFAIKDKFQEKRLQAGHNNRSLAADVGMDEGYLGEIVKGKKNPSGPLAKRIHDALGCEFQDIFFTQESDRCTETDKREAS